MQANRLHFDRFVLDLDRGCLVADGAEIALRPKTFGVLRYLAENHGRLVAKEDLFAAVWPNLVVTDDTLVQSIGELRRALGDEGGRIIKTIPRRGYRLDAAVSSIDDASVPPPAPAASAPPRRLKALRIGLVLALVVAVLGAALYASLDWRLGGDAASERKSMGGAKATIAILPLRTEGGDAMRDWFAEGLTQDIITAMGRFPELTVMSWNAVYPYRVDPVPPARVARELAVHYQVEGSVLRSSERIRVNARLVDAEGRVHWSGRFDEPVADLFALQERITRDVAGALAARVGRIEEKRASAKPAGNLEAYDYVLRARAELQRPTRASAVQARELLRRAIEIDPSCAPAYAVFAELDHLGVVMGWAESPARSLARAEEMAQKALELDAAQTSAHVTLGRLHLLLQRHDQADAELRRAIAINPSDALALAGRGNVLMWTGEISAAIDTLEHAQRIDPVSNPVDRIALGLAYYLDGRYDLAVDQLEMNLRSGTGANPTRVILAAAYARQGRSDDAARMAASVHRADPTFDPATFGSKLRNPGHLEDLRKGLRGAGLL